MGVGPHSRVNESRKDTSDDWDSALVGGSGRRARGALDGSRGHQDLDLDERQPSVGKHTHLEAVRQRPERRGGRDRLGCHQAGGEQQHGKRFHGRPPAVGPGTIHNTWRAAGSNRVAAFITSFAVQARIFSRWRAKS